MHQVRGLAPHARLVVTGEDAAHDEKLYAAGADHVVIPTSHTGLLFSPEAVRLAVGFFHQGRFEARGTSGPIR